MKTSLPTNVAITTLIVISVAPAALAQREFSIRETHGSRQIQGWEDELVRSNPNLSHFHWNPMYSTSHSYRRMSEPKTAAPAPPSGPHYIKPIHERSTFVKRPYIKPIHMTIATPKLRSTYAKPSTLPLPASRNLDGSLRPNPQVSSKLAFHDVGALLRKPVLPAAQAVRGHLLNKGTSIDLSSASVNGDLVSRNTQAALASPGALTYNSADLQGRLRNRNQSYSRQVRAELYRQ